MVKIEFNCTPEVAAIIADSCKSTSAKLHSDAVYIKETHQYDDVALRNNADLLWEIGKNIQRQAHE